MQTCFNHDDHGRPLLDMREAATARQVELPDLPTLSEDERQMAIRTWKGRMVNEHISAQVWGSLVSQLMAAALPPRVLAGVAEAVVDELRHAELCAAVVQVLGGEAVAPLPPIEPLPAHEDAPPLEAALRNIISVGCMSETVAVSIIRAEQAELEGSALGEILGSILADEVAHARLGWQVLGMCAPNLDGPTRDRLSAYLVDALAHQVSHEVPKLPRLGLVPDQLAMAGVCDGGFARSIFIDTIEQIIVPGLEQAGLRAKAAWAQARHETRHLLAS